jgi:ribonucleoside-diphosphate reductase alpha chain
MFEMQQKAEAEASVVTPAAPLPRAREREVVLCHVCGDMMQRAGSCYACPSCGSTSGCS